MLVMQPEYVTWCVNQAFCLEGVNMLTAEAVDIEGLTADKMFKSFQFLCRTDESAGTPDYGFIRFPDSEATTFGAMIRENEGFAVGWTLLRDNLDDLRNDVASALDNDGITLSNILSRYFCLLYTSPSPRDRG